MIDKTRVHIDAALSNLSIKYLNHSLVGELIAKELKVAKDSDKFFIYGKQAFKVPPTHRRDGTKANEVHLHLTTDSYSCNEYALSDIVTDNVRKNADQPLNPELDTTELLTDLILLDLEKTIATAMTTTALYTNSNYTTLSGTSQWSDYVNSTPLTDIKTAKKTIRKLIGREPNVILMGGDVAETLSLHPDIKELRKYTDPNLLTDASLPPKIMGLKVIEAKATENTVYEGGTPSLSYIWGNEVIIAYVPEGNLGHKSIASWIVIRSGSRETRKWRDDPRKGDVIEVSDKYDVKEVADECAYLIVNAIA